MTNEQLAINHAFQILVLVVLVVVVVVVAVETDILEMSSCFFSNN